MAEKKAKDAKEADAPAAEGKGKGGKKKLIIILLALVLAAGGGGGAFYFMKKKKPAGDEEAEAEQVEEAPKKHAKPIFLPLEPFTVNLSGEHNRFAQVAVTMDVATPETAEALRTIMPAVRDRVLRIVSSKTPADLLSADGKENLAAEIAEEAAKLIGWEPPDDDDTPSKRKKSAKAEEDDASEDADGKAKKKKKKKRRYARPNPINEVHFAQFIVQ